MSNRFRISEVDCIVIDQVQHMLESQTDEGVVQCGLYVDPGAIAAHADDIALLKLKATKTGVTFSVRKPITDELVEKLAMSSRSKKGV